MHVPRSTYVRRTPSSVTVIPLRHHFPYHRTHDMMHDEEYDSRERGETAVT